MSRKRPAPGKPRCFRGSERGCLGGGNQRSRAALAMPEARPRRAMSHCLLLNAVMFMAKMLRQCHRSAGVAEDDPRHLGQAADALDMGPGR